MVGAQQRTWLARLDIEDANIRAASLWSLEHGSAESALRLARALWRYWSARGRLIEGRSWLERALALPGAAETPLSVRADAHNALGNVLGDSAEYTHARQHYEEALALRRKLADSGGIAGALNNLGIVAAWLGDYDGALALHRESLELSRVRHDAFGVALSLTNLGDVLLARGDFDGAQEYHEEALRLRELMHDAAGSAYSVYNLGEIARLRGDTAEAVRYLTDSLYRLRPWEKSSALPTPSAALASLLPGTVIPRVRRNCSGAPCGLVWRWVISAASSSVWKHRRWRPSDRAKIALVSDFSAQPGLRVKRSPVQSRHQPGPNTNGSLRLGARELMRQPSTRCTRKADCSPLHKR